MIAAVQNRRAEIAELCRRYGVARLDLFGSAGAPGGEGFDPGASDLDLVVSFERRDPRISSTGTLVWKRTWRRSSGARWTRLWRAPSGRAAASRRTSRVAGCPCMGPEERVLKALEDVQDCAAFVVQISDARSSRTTGTTASSARP